MSQLQVITRPGCSPQGRPRVFFCCHDADRDACFEGITAELLHKQNCAVYHYPPHQAVPQAERELDLSQMQLFVMPVTARLLAAENQALRDFEFARAHHIPVLPLLQQQGLEAAFNARCGDLQLLNKYAADETAIAYDEKLTAYLQSVLVGDELAGRIRKAFAATVFLSYRKKDRAHAQSLMRRIHACGGCRDVAIWYDEFLTPGEDFNSSIRAALEKSSLFALAVTPSLLEKPNYVAAVEYPAAQAAKLPVLAAELVPTDRAALAIQYRGILPLTDAQDADALAAALAAKLPLPAPPSCSDDPKHCFLIGQAYLSGIDVEVDHARALELITGAAEEELPEAMVKLVSMYRTGEGVARDYRTALRWQQKLVVCLRGRHRLYDTIVTAGNLTRALGQLGDQYLALDDAENAKAAYMEMEQLTARWSGEGSNLRFTRYRSTALEMLGNACKALHDAQGALTYYEHCLQLRQHLLHRSELEGASSAQSHRELADSCRSLGRLALQQKDTDAAYQYYKQVFEHTAQLAEGAGEGDAVTMQMVMDGVTLGDIARQAGDHSSAREQYEKLLPRAEALAKASGRMADKANLALLHGRLGGIYIDTGDYAAAMIRLERDMQLRLELDADHSSMHSRRNLMACHSELSRLYVEMGDYAQARQHGAAAMRMLEQLLEEAGSADLRQALWSCHLAMGNLAMQQEAPRTAEKHFARALEAGCQLAKSTGAAVDMHGWAYALLRLGEAKQRCRKYSSARQRLLQALELYTTVMPQSAAARQGVFNVCKQLGELELQCRRPAVARPYLERALAAAEVLEKEKSSPASRSRRVIVHSALGRCALACKDRQAAQAQLARACRLAKALAADTGMRGHQLNFAYVLRDMGEFKRKTKDKPKALQYYKQAAAVCDALAAEALTVRLCWLLAELYTRLAQMQLALDELDGVEENARLARQYKQKARAGSKR